MLFAVIAAARFCHSGILWAEEALPMAAARQMLHGSVLYRDAWFDKPPLLAAAYLLWGVRDGWPLRLAGSIYVLIACALAYLFARDLWSRREGLWAAGLLAFFLTFGIPSAVLPLAADLLMLAPHVAAVYLAWKNRFFWSGVLAGVAFLVNPKGVFVLAACAAFLPVSLSLRFPVLLALGFALPNLLAAGWLWSQGALTPYYEQVWKWGRIYAGGTFLENPLASGAIRTLNWLGFHAALAVAAIWFWWKDRKAPGWRFAAWAALSFAAVAAGWRFFPRYYFQLLPVAVIVASRGFVLLGRRRAWVMLLLLVPLARFGPRYGMLAWDAFVGRPSDWRDTAMDRDSREAARLAITVAKPGDRLFVWGFRPELYVYTGMPAGSRFLDSQPLTGVPADRHLTEWHAVGADFTRANRAELARSHPEIVMDGLGLFNPHLAIERYPDLRNWLAAYRPAARSKTFTIYELKR